MTNGKSETADELTAKDLGHYLMGYGLIVEDYTPNAKRGEIEEIHGYEIERVIMDEMKIKPILRPLSDMTKEERAEYHKLEMEFKSMSFSSYVGSAANSTRYLIDRYFDVFGWIDKGLAIDATTMNPNPYEG